MKVYVVITNGEEVKGCVEGVYSTYKKARAKFKEIVKDWEDWAKDDECDIDAEENYYSMINFSADEALEASIEEKELE